MDSASVGLNNPPSGVVVHNHHILMWMMVIITISTTGALLWHFYGPSDEDKPPPGGGDSTTPPTGGDSTTPPAGSGSPEPDVTPPIEDGGAEPGTTTPAEDDKFEISVDIVLYVAAGIAFLLMVYFVEYGRGMDSKYTNEEGRSLALLSRAGGRVSRRIPSSVVFFGLPLMIATGIALIVVGLKVYDTPNKPMWITGVGLLAPTVFYMLALAGQFIHRLPKTVRDGSLVGIVIIGIALVIVGFTAFDEPNQPIWVTGIFLLFPALIFLVRVMGTGIKNKVSRLDEADERKKLARKKKKRMRIETSLVRPDQNLDILDKKELEQMKRDHVKKMGKVEKDIASFSKLISDKEKQINKVLVKERRDALIEVRTDLDRAYTDVLNLRNRTVKSNMEIEAALKRKSQEGREKGGSD